MASEVRSKRISCRLQRAQDATGGPGVVQEETVNQLSVIQTKNSPFVQQNSAAEEGAAESNQSAQHGLRAAIGAFSSKSYLHEDQVTPNSPPPPSPGLNAQGPAAPCECAPDGHWHHTIYLNVEARSNKLDAMHPSPMQEACLYFSFLR